MLIPIGNETVDVKDYPWMYKKKLHFGAVRESIIYVPIITFSNYKIYSTYFLRKRFSHH